MGTDIHHADKITIIVTVSGGKSRTRIAGKHQHPVLQNLGKIDNGTHTSSSKTAPVAAVQADRGFQVNVNLKSPINLILPPLLEYRKFFF
jgi:hypothetical protein